MDIKLDPTTNDLDLSSGGIELVDGRAAIAQHLTIRLRMFLGEWFLDQREGVPYFQRILGKKIRPNLIDQIFKNVILKTPGVKECRNFARRFDGVTREMTISFTAITDTGESLVYNTAFIVGG